MVLNGVLARVLKPLDERSITNLITEDIPGLRGTPVCGLNMPENFQEHFFPRCGAYQGVGYLRENTVRFNRKHLNDKRYTFTLQMNIHFHVHTISFAILFFRLSSSYH